MCQERRKTRIFMHTICFGQNHFLAKTVKTEKNYKNSGFSGNCKEPKMTPFFEKVFWDGWKMVFTNCVFWKAVFIWKHGFIMFSEKHSSCNIVGCSWTWQKGVFLCFFGFNGIFCFFVFDFFSGGLCLGKVCSPPKKNGYFCSLFSVSLCFSLACLTSPFHSHFLSFFSIYKYIYI